MATNTYVIDRVGSTVVKHCALFCARLDVNKRGVLKPTRAADDDLTQHQNRSNKTRQFTRLIPH